MEKFLIRLGGHNCDVPGTHHQGFSNLKRNDNCLRFYRSIFLKKICNGGKRQKKGANLSRGCQQR